MVNLNLAPTRFSPLPDATNYRRLVLYRPVLTQLTWFFYHLQMQKVIILTVIIIAAADALCGHGPLRSPPGCQLVISGSEAAIVCNGTGGVQGPKGTGLPGTDKPCGCDQAEGPKGVKIEHHTSAWDWIGWFVGLPYDILVWTVHGVLVLLTRAVVLTLSRFIDMLLLAGLTALAAKIYSSRVKQQPGTGFTLS